MSFFARDNSLKLKLRTQSLANNAFQQFLVINYVRHLSTSTLLYLITYLVNKGGGVASTAGMSQLPHVF